MVLTRPQARLSFNHVMNNVFGHGDDSVLKTTLLSEGFQDIFDLISMGNEMIDDLRFQDTLSIGQESLPLPQYLKNTVSAFKQFFLHLHYKGETICDYDWMAITQDDFGHFILSPHCTFAPKDLIPPD